MNRLQKFSKRLVEGRTVTPGIAPLRAFDPPMPRPEDWLSRLGEVARRLPEGNTDAAGAAGARLSRWRESLRREA